MNPTRSHKKFAFLLMLVPLLALPPAGAGELPNFSALVEAASPAVVNISTTQKRTVHPRLPKGMEIPDLPEDSPFGDLFRHFFGEEGGGSLPRQRETASLGSGFIISADGYVLTNYHVVEGAQEILVRTSDRSEYEAEVVGGDKRSDIALIKIEAEGLPTLETGSSEDLKVGEWVLAIGSPFGFDHSATAGIVSAKGRNLPSENYVPFIQTDVAINPGNSGGPLFGLDGKVVGVNSQIYSRTGGFMGLSFAIPIEVAMNVADQLRTTGRVSRGWIGVLIQDVNRELAESFGMEHPSGALIAQVLPGGPAEAAGLQVGDVILSYNGATVTNSAKLPPLVGASPVDRPAEVEVMRDGNRRSIGIVIRELPTDNEPVVTASKPVPGKASRLGVTVVPLGEEQRAELEIEQDAGVLVEQVEPGPAQAGGILKGDVILKLGGDWVTSVEQFAELSAALPEGRSVAVLVQRSKGPLFLALRLPE